MGLIGFAMGLIRHDGAGKSMNAATLPVYFVKRRLISYRKDERLIMLLSHTARESIDKI